MSTLMTNKLNKNVLFFFFFLSGFSGLIYESIWTQYLKLFLGHAAYSQVLVLVIFMGGMSIGSWFTAKYSARLTQLLVCYAIVEGCIGVLAIIFHTVFVNAVDFSFASIIPNIQSPVIVQLFKWSLAALLILPQSILLGSTFPLMSGGIIRHFPEKAGTVLATLYFTNSLGAAIGILVSGFVLIPQIGLPGTILVAGLINIILGLLVWLVCHRQKESISETSVGNINEKQVRQKVEKAYMIFFVCAMLTGVASFLYEIAWIRMLNQVLGTSIQAFELMLSSFILGLAIGGFWIRNRIHSFKDIPKVLGVVQLAMGSLALMTVVSYPYTFKVMEYVLAALQRTEPGYVFFNLFSHMIAMGVMLPVTICAGMTLPLITYYLLDNNYGEEAIGKVYAVNTAGAILGVILAVQIIMPVWGVKNVIISGGFIDIVLGLFLLFSFRSSKNIITRIILPVGSVILLIISVSCLTFDPLLMSSGVYRHGKLGHENKKLLFHKDGKTASVDVYKTIDEKGMDKTIAIATNGKPDAAISLISKPMWDEYTMILAAALPIVLHDNLKTAAVIGIGSGLTTHTLLTSPEIERVDTIEIESAMVEGSKVIGDPVINAHTDSRSNIIIEDAKTFFTNNNMKYDVIISEPSNPWVTGVAGLFSREFYTLLANYIEDDGYLVQWMHTYEMDINLVSTVIKALDPVFNDYDVYACNEGDMIIIASVKKEIKDIEDIKLEFPKFAKQLNRVSIKEKNDFKILKIGSKKSLSPFYFSYPFNYNSDYFPILEYLAPKDMFTKKTSSELSALTNYAAPLLETLDYEENSSLTTTLGNTVALGILDKVDYTISAIEIRDIFIALEQNKQIPNHLLKNVRLRDISSIMQFKNYVKIQQKENFKDLLLSIKTLAKATIPYLTPEELNRIWLFIKSIPGYKELPRDIHNWMEVFHRVSVRDFDKVLILALPMFPEKFTQTADNNYLLTVSMLSHIANGNNKKAVDLFDRVNFPTNPQVPVEIRLLLAYASRNL